MIENNSLISFSICNVLHFGYVVDRRLKYGNEVIQYTIISEDGETFYVNSDKIVEVL
jgi:hypothetical protein